MRNNLNFEQAGSLPNTIKHMPVKKAKKAKITSETSIGMPSSLESGVIPIVVDAAIPKVSRKRKTIETVDTEADVSSSSKSAGHTPVEPHREDAGALLDLIDQLTYQWRQRQRWHRAEKALILQGKALCRSVCAGDKTEGSKLFEKVSSGETGDVDMAIVAGLMPFLLSIEHFETPRKAIEKDIEKLAKKLPAWKWIESIKGIGALSYGGIIGESGDITKYRSVAALWKRMGVAVIGDMRQRKVSGKEDALIHGYSPGRRSHLWNVGGGIIGGMGRGPRPFVGEDISLREEWTEWQKLFVERCRYECNKDPEKFPMATVEKDGEMKESYPKHVQNRAKRYVEKRFLRKLYAEWRREIYGVSGDPDDAV